jgi:hypothetical protein
MGDSTSSATSAVTSEAISSGSLVSPYCTLAVKSHIPIKLDLDKTNFSRWNFFFRNLCGKFNLLSHIDAPPPASPCRMGSRRLLYQELALHLRQ